MYATFIVALIFTYLDPKEVEEPIMDEETVVTKMDAETIEILLDDRVATGG